MTRAVRLGAAAVARRRHRHRVGDPARERRPGDGDAAVRARLVAAPRDRRRGRRGPRAGRRRGGRATAPGPSPAAGRVLRRVLRAGAVRRPGGEPRAGGHGRLVAHVHDRRGRVPRGPERVPAGPADARLRRALLPRSLRRDGDVAAGERRRAPAGPAAAHGRPGDHDRGRPRGAVHRRRRPLRAARAPPELDAGRRADRPDRGPAVRAVPGARAVRRVLLRRRLRGDRRPGRVPARRPQPCAGAPPAWSCSRSRRS